MRRATLGCAIGLVVLLGVAPAAWAGSLNGGVIERTRADGSGSLGLSITQENLEELPAAGRSFVDLVRLVPKRNDALRGIEAGHLPEGWSFDAKKLQATGPGIPSGSFRFDLPRGWRPPATLGIDCRYRGEPVLRQELEVRSWNPVRTSTDYTDFFELPQTLRVGDPFVFDAGLRNKLGYRYDWRIENADPGLDFGFRSSPRLDGTVRYEGTVPDPFRLDDYDPHPGGVWRWQRPYDVVGRDEFGESILRSTWQPIFLPPLGVVPEPRFDAATEIVAPTSQLCVCGNVPDLGLWNRFSIGGLALGPPLVATGSSAIYGLPKGLSPGPHPIEFEPWSAAGRSTGLSSAWIEVRGNVDLETIQRGGSTPLRLEIIGSDRAFPVELANRTPSIIGLEGGEIQQLSTPGGAPNAIVRTVTGLQRGNFTVVYKVKLPTCPCDESHRESGGQCQAQYADLLSDWPVQRSFELGAELRYEPFLVPGLRSGAPPPAGCAAGRPLRLHDRFEISFERPDGAGEWGSCAKPGSADSGSLYTLAPETGESLVKLYRGCSINDRYWLLATGVSPGLGLRVTDLGSGQVKSWSPGAAGAPILDTAAFATCP